jgi:ankyrin repeat protein
LAAGQVSPDELNVQLIGDAKTGNTTGAKTVLAFGANVDAKDENGVTALMWAAGNGNTELMKLLLDKGANINAKDKDGHTALDRAKANGQTKAAKLLRETASAQGKPNTAPAGSTAPK